MDWLMDTALQAIEEKKPEMASWLRDKRAENEDTNRLEALRFVCNSLDRGNQAIVCEKLGIAHADLQATARVLRTI